MSDTREAIESLLVETEREHGAYETSELNGVYDDDWPSWYARHAVERGVGALVGRDVSPDELATFLARAHEDFQRSDLKRGRWAGYIAQRMVTEL